MSNKVQVNVRLNKKLRDEFVEYVKEVEGSKSHYMGKHVENALREYLDNDRLARIEADIEEIRYLLERGGGGSSRVQGGEEKNKSESSRTTNSSERYNPGTYSGTLSKPELRNIANRRDEPGLEIDPAHVDANTIWNNTDLYIAVCRGILRYAHAHGDAAVVPHEKVVDVVKEYCGSTPHYVDTYAPQVLNGFFKLTSDDEQYANEAYSATKQGLAHIVRLRIENYSLLIKTDIIASPDPDVVAEEVQTNYEYLKDLKKPAKRASVEGTYRRVIEEIDELIDQWKNQSLDADRIREMADDLISEGRLTEDRVAGLLNDWEKSGFSAQDLATDTEIAESYEILGLSPEATDEEVTERYRSLVLETHPDHSSSSDAATQIDEITRARDIILGK